MNNKYNFKQMSDDLNYIGNNDPYVQDLYFTLLKKLEELSELQKNGKITICE